MKVLVIVGLACMLKFADAQVMPRPAAPKAAQTFEVPQGWVLVQPNEVPSKGFKGTPYMIPFGAVGQNELPAASSRSAVDTILIRTQTDSIKALAKRIEELDARVKELENQRQGVAKK